MNSPRELGYRWPAEWEPHRATWLSWPHQHETWPNHFKQAEQQFANFAHQLTRFEDIEVLVSDVSRVSAQCLAPPSDRIRHHEVETNDAWIRDYGPIFLSHPTAPPALVDFRYNAWGEKYPPYDLDQQVGEAIALLTSRHRFAINRIIEGGAIDGNGAGTILSTRRCLLDRHRNDEFDLAAAESCLRNVLAADHVIWLEGEIPGDDTDGHIDQIARFIASHVIVLTDLPGSNMFDENRARLLSWSARHSQSLEIVRLTAPEPQLRDQIWLPATYANFCFVNGGLLVPTFDSPKDDVACDTLQDCFPDREIVPIPAAELIFGLGAVHCLSQQEPRSKNE